MGMYTQFHFASELKKETPEEVITILGYMAGFDGTEQPEKLPDHEFFKCDRWCVLFRMSSYYFDYKTHCDFSFDEIANAWYLSVTSNLKNCNEIEEFVDWISPYLQKYEGEFLGYSRYEEVETPTIIYMTNTPKSTT